MAELKARREGKIKREEAEEERKKKKEEKKKEEEEQKKKVVEEEEEEEPAKPETKLKASDIYSDDSDDDGKSFFLTNLYWAHCRSLKDRVFRSPI